MVFNCNEALCFFVTMTTTVDISVMRYVIPGALYTFIMKQDSGGAKGFSWPANCVNAAAIDTAPNAMTIQNFIGTDAGTLLANISGSFF